jgi:hypothetical protein
VLVNQEGKVYMFKEAYVRTSSQTYTLDAEQIADVNVHLTNNAVQKHQEDYGKFEDGNVMSLD